MLLCLAPSSQVTLGCFELGKKGYKRIEVNEQVEVLSLVGNIAISPKEGNEPKLHAHVVIGKSDGTAHSGHSLQAKVRSTLEVVLIESPLHPKRYSDAETGLALLKIP